ncbi:inner-membrane translocator [Candidatus Moduliflexus flocculans]|uniref:Inner-membrane translocator n=1 Tax=Candidatus Moduliflexus flocculans TaxID=1499966 RepID=A0A081BMT3_9BACT|nr:inner-membrane translocator [Candidatus Moduliflexus flocculans]
MFLSEFLDAKLFSSMIRMATPIVLVALGGVMTSQAGILNISLEGTMLLSAFFAILGSYWFHNAFAGVMFALLAGLAMSALFSLFVIKLKADEFVIGIALNILAGGLTGSGGLTGYCSQLFFKTKGSITSDRIVGLPSVHLPFLDAIPFVGEILNNHSLFIYLSWLLVAMSYYFLYYTKWGMWMRASGEHPEALETAGVSVLHVRYVSAAICGVCCALAGAHLSLGYLTMYAPNMSAGRGWIAIAASILGKNNPLGVFGASLIFGAADGTGMRLQGMGLPSQFALMIPYVVTILVLFIVAKRRLKTA